MFIVPAIVFIVRNAVHTQSTTISLLGPAHPAGWLVTLIGMSVLCPLGSAGQLGSVSR